MDEELLSLFLSEARERVDALESVLSGGPLSEPGVQILRRELHALKGAGRMMGLADIADAAHRGEDALDPLTGDSASQVRRILDQIAHQISGLTNTGGVANGTDGTKATRVDADAIVGLDDDEARLQRQELDQLSENEAKMRVVAAAAEGLVASLFQLSHAAEAGVGDRHPEQILATLSARLRNLALEAERGQRSLVRLINRQLDILLGVQLQPLEPLFNQLGRHVRELAALLGRDVTVVLEPESCQLDRRIVRTLRESLLHLVRNAVDHGIEPAEERAAAGKSATGTVLLKATRVGERIQIEVADDGRGVSREQVFAAARARGLDERLNASMPDAAVYQLLFTSGFSTARTTTQISGRGIGLDAVAAAVQRVGGEVWMTSSVGRGSRITLDIPVAQRGERVVIVGVGGARIGIPEAVVRSYGRLPIDHSRDGSPADEPTRVVLADLLGLPRTGGRTEVQVTSGGVLLSLVVDEVLSEEEVFAHPLPSAVGHLPLYSGMALGASGYPIPLVDPSHVVAAMADPGFGNVRAARTVTPLRVLLVDDSRVTRTMMRRYLVDEGFEVTAAGNGVEGWAQLKAGMFDCLVTDIEMPEMDGLELTRLVRSHPEWQDLPIVVVSTRDRTSDRMAGLDAGADAYVAKQNLDSQDLAVIIRRLGGQG